MKEAVIDKRERIAIPRKLRAELKLRPDQKLRIESRGRFLIFRPPVNPYELIRQLKGYVSKSGVEIEELRSIWGSEHARH